MELYDIIEAINTVDSSKGQYVLHKYMQVQFIKVYKKFVYDLYYVNKEGRTKVLSKEFIDKVPNNSIEKAWQRKDKQMLTVLLKWFKYGDEQISNSSN